MESTGGTGKKAVNTFSEDKYCYIPCIDELGLKSKNQHAKLQKLFDKYLKPTKVEGDREKQDVQKMWGAQFKEGLSQMAKKDINDETMFIVDMIIYYLYHEIVNDRSKYPKAVPFVDFPVEIIEFLIKKVQKVFEDDQSLVQFEAPVKIFGDIHGQFSDLLHMLKEMNEKNKADQGNLIISKNSRYLFLGDYVNRGRQSIEVICLLFAMKVRFPKQIVLLRGNHETQGITRIYGFFDEVKRRYKINLWQQFYNCFNYMPLSALVDEKIMCMHGGISKEMNSFEQVEKVPRPTDVPDQGLVAELLWNDPDDDANGWEENERGCGMVFGKKQLEEFLKRYDIDLVVRGHQVMEDGYGFFGKHKQLVTIFSAKNYCGDFDNDAAVMNVDQDLMCKFITFKGDAKKNAAKNKGAAGKKKNYYF